MAVLQELNAGVREFLLALADDKHLMGQQHAEWIGIAPFLEEDLAFCSIGQDELGHAALIYELMSGSDDRDIDALAYERSAEEYRSCWLVETPLPDWTDTLVRHWMFDFADQRRWGLLADSSISEVADLARRVEREEAYHRRHVQALLDSLMADAASQSLIEAAVQRVAPMVLGLFDASAGETEAIAAGVASAPFHSCLDSFQAAAVERFGTIAWGQAPAQQHRTARSEYFAPLMTRMREVFDYDPEAVW